jgi:uncharacterized protein (TIGR03437 family)
MLADDEGWMTIGTYDEPETNLPDSGVFENEIIQVALDGSQRVRRICHTRSFYDTRVPGTTAGYLGNPKPTISKDGRFIAFTSNWENSGRYDLFIARVEPDSSVSPSPSPTPTPTPTATPTPTPTTTPTPTQTPALASPPLVSGAYATASALATTTSNSAEKINLLATNIYEAYYAFYYESGRFASPGQIDGGLRAALYFARAAAALTSARAPTSAVQSRLQIAAAQLGQVTSMMQASGGNASLGSTSHATSTAPVPVIGVGDIRSSASLAPAISPGSLGTILGNPAISPLATRSNRAAQTADGSLPYELAGVSVTIAGRAAPLISVSPEQVSFYIPSDINTGVIEFLVTSQDGHVSRGTANIAPALAVPAIFTTNGTGTGAGVVLNAATGAPGGFDVSAPTNFGPDKRTRLMIMATGISNGAANSNAANDVRTGTGTIVNLAESVRVEARTRDGRVFSLPVEFAGLASRFLGLEQVNVVLIPELQGAGGVELTIIVGTERSNIAGVTIR